MERVEVAVAGGGLLGSAAACSAPQLGDRVPQIAAGAGERMLNQPDSGVCLAGRTVAALQRLARRAGVQLRPRTQVLGIGTGGGRAVLRTAAGDISARVAVVTAGPWLAGEPQAAAPGTRPAAPGTRAAR